MPSRAARRLRAGLLGAALAGVPSTVHALVTGGDVLEPTRAAGAILLPHEQRTARLLVAAGAVHLALSLGWAAVIPRRAGVMGGALAGLAIAALDLGVIGRRFERIRALAVAPQVADHVAYGAVVGWALSAGR